MNLFLIILSTTLIVSVGIYISTKFFGKFKDENNNGIPDELEDKVEEVKEVVKEVKSRVKRVSEEAKDVSLAIKEVVKQSKDVVKAAGGNTKRRGRKPSK